MLQKKSGNLVALEEERRFWRERSGQLCRGRANGSNQIGGQSLVGLTVFGNWNRWITDHRGLRQAGEKTEMRQEGALARQGFAWVF